MEKTIIKVYKFGDPMCPKCECNPNCVCHIDDGRGGCKKCGVCNYYEKAT